MAEISESEFEAFEEDLNFLIKTLKDSFNSTEARFYIDEQSDTLFVELEGLHEYTREETTEIASPILEELDLDFEEIILIPLK